MLSPIEFTFSFIHFFSIVMNVPFDDPDGETDNQCYQTKYTHCIPKGKNWLLSLNVRSLTGNRYNVQDMLEVNQPSIVALQEVWEFTRMPLVFPGKERSSRKGGGGVGFLIKNDFITYTIPSCLSKISYNCEMIGIETERSYFISIYLPPNACIFSAIEEL